MTTLYTQMKKLTKLFEETPKEQLSLIHFQRNLSFAAKL